MEEAERKTDQAEAVERVKRGELSALRRSHEEYAEPKPSALFGATPVRASDDRAWHGLFM